MGLLSTRLEAPLELVIIGGAYKSGTSRLCELVEANGYCNPSSITNATERGHGISAGMYLTRECSIARDLNRQLVKAGPRGAVELERKLASYLKDMSGVLGPRLVLKDPYMKITALSWFRAARAFGASQLKLLLTDRYLPDVRRSWESSQFMTRMERVHTEQFRQLITPISSNLRKQLSVLAVKTHVLKYQDIILDGYFREMADTGYTGQVTSPVHANSKCPQPLARFDLIEQFRMSI